MNNSGLKIATCQFAVSNDIEKNASEIIAQMKKAARSKADIVHFPETALSGYAGFDFDNFSDFNWKLLREKTQQIQKIAAELNLWTVLGSTHPLNTNNKPHNCLYLIGPRGDLISRYDKRFLMKSENDKYTPGDHFVNFTVNDINCSLLICFDCRFPEIYRQLKKENVQFIIQSFYNARQKGPSVHTHIMRQTMQTRAAENHFWVSMSNASGRYQPYPSCFIQPDGKIVKQLKPNTASVMINTIDKNKKFYDPMQGLREIAMRGQLSSDITAADARSKDTLRL